MTLLHFQYSFEFDTEVADEVNWSAKKSAMVLSYYPGCEESGELADQFFEITSVHCVWNENC